MTDKAKTNRIALWQREQKGNKAPCLTGEIDLKDGTKLKVSLWRNSNKKAKAPTFTGTIETLEEFNAAVAASQPNEWETDF